LGKFPFPKGHGSVCIHRDFVRQNHIGCWKTINGHRNSDSQALAGNGILPFFFFPMVFPKLYQGNGTAIYRQQYESAALGSLPKIIAETDGTPPMKKSQRIYIAFFNGPKGFYFLPEREKMV